MTLSRITFTLSLIWLLIISFSSSEAQWQSNGPYGGSANTIAISPTDANIAYVGTNKGLFLTTDGGKSWTSTKVTDGINSIFIDSIDPNIVYAATNQGFYKSRNAGVSWGRGGGFSFAWQIFIDPLNRNLIYAATQEGLMVSEGGAFWETLPLPLDKGIGVEEVIISPKDPKTIYAISQGRWRNDGYDAQSVFKSVDGGITWKAVFSVQKFFSAGDRAETQITSILIDPASPQTIYLGLRWGNRGEISDVHKSVDGGGSWKQIFRQHANINAMVFDPINSGIIYVGSNNDLFRLTEGGAKSELLKGFFNESVQTIAISPKNPNVIYIGTTRSGVYKSVDGGKSWSFASFGISALPVSSVNVDARNGQLYAGTENGVYKSSDSGLSWNLVAGSGQRFFHISPYPIATDSIHVASDNGVLKSFDGGKSWWTSASAPREAVAVVAVASSDPNTVYAGYSYGGRVYKSSDGGQSWEQFETPNVNHVHAIAVDPADKNLLYGYINANPDGWAFYRSIDGGRSWSRGEHYGDGWHQPQKLAVDPLKSGTIYIASSSGSPSGLQKSTDGGKSWKVVGFANRHMRLVLVDPGTPTAVYATDGSFIQVSFDGGGTWEEIAASAPQQIKSLAVDPQLKNVIYAGTEGGVYVLKASNDLVPPSSPTEVKATAEANKISITWKPSPEPDVAGYKVYYGSQPGTYTRIIDAKKSVSYSISDLISSPFHFISVSSYDTSRNESKRSDEVSLTIGSQITQPVSLSFSFKMSLSQGLNLVSLPLKPTLPFSARSFSDWLNSSFLIDFDTVNKKFVAFSPQVHTGEGFAVEGGKGYIVNLITPMEKVLVGSGWSKAAPAKEADPTWAFLVSGSIPTSDLEQLGYSQLKVKVTNRYRGGVAVEPVGVLEAGKFAAAFVDFSKKSVAAEGDILDIYIESPNGDVIAGPFSHKIGTKEIAQAQLLINFRADQLTPKHTKLLQNYPNPFNPETWIPFQLSETSEVKVQIYDVSGDLIRELNLGRLSPGIYSHKGRAAYWDGRNQMGEKVASGIYFYSLVAGKFREVRKLAISK